MASEPKFVGPNLDGAQDVSIVMATFNGEKHVAAQLESLAAQTLPPVELIVAVVAAMVVTLTTGLLANRGVTSHPPLEVLRNEV